MGIGSVNKKRAIFLDRDGVINESIVKNGKPYAPLHLAELKIIDGVPVSLRRLKEMGFLLIVVTNQPDVSRGSASKNKIEAIHNFLKKELILDDIYVCFHDEKDQCDCRKPKPGLLLQAAEKYKIDLNQSVMVGDRWRDIAAGRAAGCKTFFVDYGYQERQPEQYDFRVNSLEDVVQIMEKLK